MASFITQAKKDEINLIFDSFHDTFSRPIICYKIGQRTVISSNENYNAFYQEASNNTETTTVSLSTEARIRYLKAEEELFSNKDGDSKSSQSKIILPAGTVKIKVNQDGYDFIKEAKRIEFENGIYSIVSNGRPIGIFGPKYFEFILIPTDE